MKIETLQAALKWAADRLKEPSTVISLGFALAYFHIPVTETALHMGVDGARDIIVGVSIFLGIYMPEKSAPSTVPMTPAAVSVT
jgi:hypothetical protein